MDAHIKKVYVPMTETGFYILLCLKEPNHGYGIVQKVKEMTAGDIILSPGTMYGSLSKMERDGLIHFIREEEKRKENGRSRENRRQSGRGEPDRNRTDKGGAGRREIVC